MTQRLVGLQVLRFIAAAFVVFDHTTSNIIDRWSNDYNIHQFFWQFGEVGVAVFFCISGFIMVNTQFNNFGNYRCSVDFLIRRVIRIFPLYAIATMLEYINKYNVSDIYNGTNLVKSLLFIPYIGENGLYRPILGMGWTLNYEMLFYLLFTISLLLPRTVGLILNILLLLAFMTMNWLGYAQNGILAFYANDILAYFVWGIISCIICTRYSRKFEVRPSLLFILIVTSMIGLVIVKPYIENTIYICFSGTVVLISISICSALQYSGRSPGTELFERLGDASYSIYLFHGFVLGGLNKLFADSIGNHEYIKAGIFVSLCIFCSSIVGLFIYSLVEAPLSALLNRSYRAAKSAMPVPL